MRIAKCIGLAAGAAAVSIALVSPSAGENYESWQLLQIPFESTGGGGIMIGEYRPVIVGTKCATNFTATEPGPGGKVYHNKVEFDTVEVQGGTLCTNGRWQAIDGSMSGTTPLRVFLKNGVTRRSP